MRVIVIGAGISGLACAWRLAERRVEAIVLESAGRAGGIIDGIARNGFIFELGPQSFQQTPALGEFIHAAGLEEDLLAAPARAARYVLAGGRLRRAPMGPEILVNGELLGLSTRLRLLRDLVGWSKPPDREESVADFARRKFGGELLDRLAGPFVSGVYAGDPERLGYRDAFPDLHLWESEKGSILRGALRAMRLRGKGGRGRAALVTLLKGNASLPQRVAAKLGERIRFGTSVESVVRAQPAGLEARCVSAEGRCSLAADAVVCCAPADHAGRILAGLSLRLGELLQSIEYAPVAVVGTGYRREQVRHPLDGFGFLVARSESRKLLGTVWSSSLFPKRAPAGMVNLASFVGGATDPAATELAPAAIGEMVEKELAEILGITGPPAERVVQVHRRALPQYNVGHRRLVEQIRSEAARVGRLFLAGNFLDGPSTGACVELGFRVAEEAVSVTAGVV
ncbi:MAG TPA: protoporphyrinogen oxidase [Candidatus Acidoferrales bacterium]|nr:protoporphyrinogen oxidase [Candidatus Acidoferrales bacterium]